MLAGMFDYPVRMLPGAVLGALLFCCLLPLRQRRLLRAGLHSPFPREILMLLFFIFCGGMALITLTPRWFHWLTFLDIMKSEPFFQIGTFNLVPFRTFSFNTWSFIILVGNVIMFLPIGFFYVLLWRSRSWKPILLLGLLTTLCIEVFQLFIGRAFDIDDILLNTVGVVLGGLFCRYLRRMAPELYSLQVQNT